MESNRTDLFSFKAGRPLVEQGYNAGWDRDDWKDESIEPCDPDRKSWRESVKTTFPLEYAGEELKS